MSARSGYSVIIDMQYAYLTLNKKDCPPSVTPMVLTSPIRGSFDPRVWVGGGENTMIKRVQEGLEDFNTAGQL